MLFERDLKVRKPSGIERELVVDAISLLHESLQWASKFAEHLGVLHAEK